MTLNEYYNIIIEKYKNGEYKVKTKKGGEIPTIDENKFVLYAHDYLIYEWLLDHKDNRWKKLIEYIVVPNGVNQKDCDIDFNTISFEDFYTFLINLK